MEEEEVKEDLELAINVNKKDIWPENAPEVRKKLFMNRLINSPSCSSQISLMK